MNAERAGKERQPGLDGRTVRLRAWGVPAAAAQDGGIIHFITFGFDLTGAHLLWAIPLPH